MPGNKVRIGSRDFIVERTPLPVRYLASGAHDKFVLEQPGDGQLSLRSSRSVRVMGWIFCAVGWPLLILGLLATVQALIRLEFDNLLVIAILLAVGGLFSVLGMKLLGRRCRFDSRSSELTIRHFWRTRRRTFADVVAVQVIDAGKFGSDEEKFTSYQLNLVLDDPTEPRLFVAFNADLPDMQTKAKQVADFLQVPLLAPPIREPKPKRKPRPAPAPGGEQTDPTKDWAQSDEPLPSIDPDDGTVGDLTIGDPVEDAEFLGRPDRVERTSESGMTLHYLSRGFELQLSGEEFVELRCHLAPRSGVSPQAGQAYCRPRLTDGTQITPQMNVEQVREVFGPPTNEDIDDLEHTLTYADAHYMVFEFEPTTGRLVSWSMF